MLETTGNVEQKSKMLETTFNMEQKKTSVLGRGEVSQQYLCEYLTESLDLK